MEKESIVQREKDLTRQRIIKLRNGLTPQELREKSILVEDKLFGINQFKQASVAMFYVSFRNEVHTPSMISRAIRAGKKVGIPIVCKDEGRLLISELHDMDGELQPGSFGVLEPKPQFIRPMKLQQIEAVVLPGVAFDESGRRLGYGGGYYDRLLQSAGNKLLVGLAYEFQIVSALPGLDHDVGVNLVVTEQRIIYCPN